MGEVRYVAGLASEAISKYAIQPGDLLFTRYNGSRGLVGRCARVPEHEGPIIHPDKLIRVVLRGDLVDSRFLALLTESESVRRFLEPRIKTTAGQSGITGKDVREIPISYPELGEQRQIVEILEDHLSRLDAAEMGLSHVLRRREILRVSQLQAVECGAPVRLDELAVSSGYGTSTKCGYEGSGVPVVRIPNLVNGMIDMADTKYALDTSANLSSLMLEDGDLLIVRTNGSRDLIGRTAVVQSAVRAAFASYLIRFKIDRTRARPKWIRLMFETSEVRQNLESMAASSAGQYNLGLAKLNRIEIPCPSLDEQDRLIAQASEAEWKNASLLRATSDAHNRSRALRSAVLAAAFSGRLTGRVADMDIVEEMAGV